MLLTITVASPPSVAEMVQVTDRPAAWCTTTGAGQAAVSGALVAVQMNLTVTGFP